MNTEANTAPQGFNDSFVSRHIHPSFWEPSPVMPDSDTAPHADTTVSIGEAMERINAWKFATSHKPGDALYLKAIALRSIAAQWCINPNQFGGLSLRKLATRLGIKAATLAPLTADFSRQFGISNAFKGHDWRN